MAEYSREQLLQDLQTSQHQVVTLLETMADVQDWQPEPAEWSFRYIAAHLATVEKHCHLRRVTRIASGDRPHFEPYANKGCNFGDRDLRDSLQKWVATRQRLLAFVRNLSERELTFTGIHETMGAITVLDALVEILEQDQGNLRHVRQLIIDFYEEAHRGLFSTAQHRTPLFFTREMM